MHWLSKECWTYFYGIYKTEQNYFQNLSMRISFTIPTSVKSGLVKTDCTVLRSHYEPISICIIHSQFFTDAKKHVQSPINWKYLAFLKRWRFDCFLQIKWFMHSSKCNRMMPAPQNNKTVLSNLIEDTICFSLGFSRNAISLIALSQVIISIYHR